MRCNNRVAIDCWIAGSTCGQIGPRPSGQLDCRCLPILRVQPPTAQHTGIDDMTRFFFFFLTGPPAVVISLTILAHTMTVCPGEGELVAALTLTAVISCAPDALKETALDSASSAPDAGERPPHLLVPGHAHSSVSGPLLYSTTPLSFWGGVDPPSGRIVDVHHPLAGASLAGNVLALPSGRGSCSGSLGVLECISSGQGPVALVLAEPDKIMALGALVAHTVFGRGIPVAAIGRERYARLASASSVTITTTTSGGVLNASLPGGTLAIPLAPLERLPGAVDVKLTPADKAMLGGERGLAAKEAMELVTAMARMYGARSLTDVTRAHIDAVIYVGPATLAFAQHFASLGVYFAVPTTLNAVSAPRDWQALGVPPADAEPATALADAYLALGADGDSLTCAPYFLPDGPGLGESVGWAESNAVVYANSVLGARTLKYPDMLDVAVALTGRAPLAGAHLDEERRPRVRVQLAPDVTFGEGEGNSLMWPLLGYCVGGAAGHDVVVVQGLEGTKPRSSDLKAFGAAFGTTSGSPMFHIRGVTPEAPASSEFDVDRSITLERADLVAAWDALNSAKNEQVGLVALGNPHLALDEFAELAELVTPLLARGVRAEVPLVLTAGRHVVSEAEDSGYLELLRRFGATVVEDTCWCMVKVPIVPPLAQSVITNSAKYAHYGPGGVGKPMYFASTADCIQAAVSARCARQLPSWLA